MVREDDLMLAKGHAALWYGIPACHCTHQCCETGGMARRSDSTSRAASCTRCTWLHTQRHSFCVAADSVQPMLHADPAVLYPTMHMPCSYALINQPCNLVQTQEC